MATEKTPLKIYRGVNGTNTSSGSVPALQAGTLIFNEGLGFFTLDVNTSKATVSDAAKTLLNDTVNFINESLSSADSFKILSSNDNNNNIMRLPLLASGAFYATYADRATQANMANYTQLGQKDELNSHMHHIGSSFLRTGAEYNLSTGFYNAFNINGSDYSDNMGVFSPEFAEAISEEQDINLPVKFYNSVYISSDAAQRIPNGSDESLWTLNIINPILKLGRQVKFETGGDIKLIPEESTDNLSIVLEKYLSALQQENGEEPEQIVHINNYYKSTFIKGITTSSSYTPNEDYDLVTVAYMRDNAGGKAIFRRWA